MRRPVTTAESCVMTNSRPAVHAELRTLLTSMLPMSDLDSGTDMATKGNAR
jgi:hypothetical protein